MFVKICGITNEEDALLAVAMGADAVGFVFAPSPRQIAVTQARDIARRLPPEVMTVGVFRDEASRRVVEMVNAAGLHGVQLHGHETPAEGRWIRQRVQFLIQAFPAGDRMLERVDEYQAADAVMIDSPSPGSGQVFDWVLAEGLPLDRRVILAGGLTADNVAEAVAPHPPLGRRRVHRGRARARSQGRLQGHAVRQRGQAGGRRGGRRDRSTSTRRSHGPPTRVSTSSTASRCSTTGKTIAPPGEVAGRSRSARGTAC